MRIPLIAGNWKMHKTVSEAVSFVQELRAEMAEVEQIEVIVCPPYTAISEVARALAGTRVGVGAQDVFWKAQGAFTSQVSAAMLLDAGCTYAIIGHSETRGRFGKVEEGMTSDLLRHFGETDESVNAKIRAALDVGLKPIMCCGETLNERQAGKADDVIRGQVEKGLSDLRPAEAAGIVIAYEPVWAIGTGEVCETPEAERVCGLIRSVVRGMFDDTAAAGVRIQYGGSVKPDNACDLLGQANIDGALVGGASLKVADFMGIIRSS